MAGCDQSFIVGAQRCGSTTVAAALARHPEVALAQPMWPEPKFFLEPGASNRIPEYLARLYPDVGPGVRLRCEKSTSYMESEVARDQIAESFPTAHIVVVLRDPVRRALSHYAYTCSNGLENLPPTEALDPAAEARPWNTDVVSVSPYRYLSRGRYVDDLRRWDDRFGPQRVHVAILEELVAAPERLTELEADLGLGPGPPFLADERHNAGDRLVPIDRDTRARLATFFTEANADLAERLGRPLEHWTHA